MHELEELENLQEHRSLRRMYLELNFTDAFYELLKSKQAKLPLADGQILNNDQLVDVLFELIPKMSETRVVYHQEEPAQRYTVGIPDTDPPVRMTDMSRLVSSAAEVPQAIREQSMPAAPENPSDWSINSFPWKEEIQLINKEIFQHESFRPLQEAIINAVLSGSDVFSCLPTGSGKSLFYQLPALVKSRSPGVTIVVMPLVALISDQKRQFEIYGMSCMSLGTSDGCLQKISRKISDLEGSLKPVIFTSPEILDDNKVFEFVKKLHRNKQLDRIVFDEAHCILEWGSTFRKAYTQLRKLRSNEFWAPQIVMLTGSASPFQRRTLMKTIKLKDPAVFVLSHDRPNIFLSVVPKKSEDSDLKLILEIATRRYPNKSGIIYCRTKKMCDKVCTELTNRHCRAECFTGEMTVKEKQDILSRWLVEETQVVVATIAFGMGINKPDCRFVIHYETPSSIENYYQGAGRAGRDGRPSLSLIMFNYSDIRKQDLLMGDDNHGFRKYMQMYLYAMDTGRCRRNMLLSYFQPDAPTNCNYCDNCVLSEYVSRGASQNVNPLESVFSARVGQQKVEKIDLVEEAFNLNDKLIYLGYARVPGEGKANRFKKKKKKKSSTEEGGDDKFPNSLTSVRLCDALTSRKPSSNSLSMIAEQLPRGMSSQKQDAVAHFLIASMIRDGLLQTKFVNTKARFGFVALHPTVDVDDADSAINPDSYVLYMGRPLEERSLDLILTEKKERLRKLKQDGRPLPEDEEEEHLMSQLTVLRSVLFRKTFIQNRGRNTGAGGGERGRDADLLGTMDEERQNDHKAFETIEQFMPNEVMKELVARKPKDFDELKSIKIFPRDLWQFYEAILSIFKPGGYSRFEQEQKSTQEVFFKSRQLVKNALSLLEFEEDDGDNQLRPSHDDKLVVSNDDELSRASELFRPTAGAMKKLSSRKRGSSGSQNPKPARKKSKNQKEIAQETEKVPKTKPVKPKVKKQEIMDVNPSDVLSKFFFGAT